MKTADKKLIASKFGPCPKNTMSKAEYRRWGRIFSSYAGLISGNPYPVGCSEREKYDTETSVIFAQNEYWRIGIEWLSRRQEWLKTHRRCSDGSILCVYDQNNARRVPETDPACLASLAEFGLSFSEFRAAVNPIRKESKK